MSDMDIEGDIPHRIPGAVGVSRDKLANKVRKLRFKVAKLQGAYDNLLAAAMRLEDSGEEADDKMTLLAVRISDKEKAYLKRFEAIDMIQLQILGRLDSMANGTAPLPVDAPTVFQGTVIRTLGDDITIRLADKEDEDERYFVKGDVVNVVRITTVNDRAGAAPAKRR